MKVSAGLSGIAVSEDTPAVGAEARVVERYSHVRMEAKRTAMEALAVSTKTAGYDTNRDTNAVVACTRPV